MRSYRGFRVPLAIAFVLGVVVKLIMLSADSDTVDMSLPVGAHKLDLDFGPIEDYEEEEEKADDGVKMEKVTVMDLPVPPEVQIHMQQPEPEAEHTDGDTTQLIILFAYMRGGSSFMGGVFETNPQVFYWYEAFWDIYNAMTSSSLWQFPIHVVFDKERQLRNITDYERRFIRKQMRKMFTCRLDSVPIESLTSWTLDKSPRAAHRYSSCLQIYGVNNKAWNECQRDLHPVCSDHTENCLKIDCHKYMELTRLQVHIQKTNFPSTKRYKDCMYPVKTAIGQCLRFLQEQCDARPIKVVKVLRTRMDVMEDLLQEFPNMKVIHQLRDPRGTIISRWKGMRLYTRNLTQEADMLCRKMVDDIKTRRRLEEKYPRVFLEAKYERLATHPLQTTEELYLHSEIPLTGVVKDWVANMTSGDEDGTAFQLKTKNATATTYAWQNVLSPEEKREIDVVCAELYKLADYEV